MQVEVPEVEVQARRGRPARVPVSAQATPKRGRPARVIDELPARRGRGRPPKKASETELLRGAKIDPVAKITKRRGRKSRTSSAPAVPVKPARFSIKNISGEFAIECRAISANWSEDFTYEMRINIRRADDEGRVTAAFDLGFITGTIRLSRSRADLKEWCDPDSDEEEVQEPATPSSSPPVERQPAPSPDSDGPRRSKRVKIEEQGDEENVLHADRVYLQWRGLSSVGEARFFDDVKQIGWLDFPRTDGAAFWGCIDFPQTLGAGIWLLGMRISKKAAKKPTPWDAYEDALSEAEKGDAEDEASGDEGAIDRHRAPTAQMTNGEIEEFESDVHFDVPETQFA